MIQRNRLIAGTVAGLVGGLVLGLLYQPTFGWPTHLALSAVLGALFGWGFGAHLHTMGSGVMWGQAFGLLWWLVGILTLVPLLTGEGLQWTLVAIQANFPALLGHIVAFGAVMGLVTVIIGRFLPLVPPDDSPTFLAVPPLIQALVVGSVSGLIGAWAFLRGVQAADFFPLVAGLVGSDSAAVGSLLHYAIGLTIALTFAILFQRNVRGVGPALIWGMSYGFLWWIIGPLTLAYLLSDASVTWTLEDAQGSFSGLISHLLYGAVVGFCFAIFNRLWHVLFIDSDPVNRTREGAGARNVRGLLIGQAGGLIGGLLFTFIQVGLDALPTVASLVGAESRLAGLLVHLLIALIVGSTFGLFFQREAYSLGAGMGWGVLYGVLWWIIGSMTLLPALLRQPIDWSLTVAVARYPALLGHLLYGMGLGLFHQYLARRYDIALATPQRRTSGTAAAAMWATVVLIATMFPLLLAN